jgi:hypothetical protein
MYDELLRIRESRNHMHKIAQQIHIYGANNGGMNYPPPALDDTELKAHLTEALQAYADADAVHQAAQQQKELGLKRMVHILAGMGIGGALGAGIGSTMGPEGAVALGGLGAMAGLITGAVRGQNESERLYPGVAQHKMEAAEARGQAKHHLSELADLDPKLYERQRLLSGMTGLPSHKSFQPAPAVMKPVTDTADEESEWQ